MAFSPSFTAEQLYDTPTILRVTDTSTDLNTFTAVFDETFYEDAFLAKRKLYLRKDDGTYLVPIGTTTDYIVWDDTSFIDVDVLDKDYALEIKVVMDILYYPNIFDNTFTSTFN